MTAAPFAAVDIVNVLGHEQGSGPPFGPECTVRTVRIIRRSPFLQGLLAEVRTQRASMRTQKASMRTQIPPGS